MILGSAVRWRLPLVGAAVALTLAFAACGDDAAVTTTVTTTNPTTTAPAGGTVTTAAAPASLGDALAMVGARYGFSATVAIDGQEVTRVEGTVYDGTGAYTVVAGGTVVEYVVSDQGQWAREPGGAWQELSGAAPLADPVAPLAAPLAVTVVESTGDDAVLAAVYDGAALGFSSGGEVAATLTIVDGVLVSISYDASVDGRTATVTTVFDPSVPVAPIQVPPA